VVPGDPGVPRTLAPTQYTTLLPELDSPIRRILLKAGSANFSADRVKPVFASGTAFFSVPLRTPPASSKLEMRRLAYIMPPRQTHCWQPLSMIVLRGTMRDRNFLLLFLR